MDGDDYGDDFEDYEDVEEDSQAVELQAKMLYQSKQQVSALSGMQKKASLIGEPLRDLKAIQSALNRENTSLERRVARFAGEKYTHEDLTGLEEKGRTEEARKEPKCAASTADNKIDVEMQSESINMEDREVQFANGNDDTEFENLVVKIMCQRASSCGHQPKREGANKNKSKSSPVASLELRPLLKENTKSISTQRLPAFVRNASPVVEALIDKKSDTLVPKCFQDTPFGPSTWIQITKSMRPIIRVAFPPMQKSVILTLSQSSSHIKDSTEEAFNLATEQMHLKDTQLALWSISGPTSPALLRNSGASLTCTCFLSTNSFVVAAGSSAGAIVLWDLRNCNILRADAHHAAYTTDSLHISSVVELCPINDRTAEQRGSTFFQLASIDDRGLVAVWLVVDSQNNYHPSLAQATASQMATSYGGTTEIDNNLAPRAGSSLSLDCSCSFWVTSTIPNVVSPHYHDSLRSAELLESVPEACVGPHISAFIVLPANPDEFLASFGVCIKKKIHPCQASSRRSV